jgi:CRP-like cAMP-binding protein
MDTVENLLSEHPFLKGLNRRYFDVFKKCADQVQFAVEQSILEEGADANRFYLISSGQVALTAFVPGRGVVTIQTIGAGEPLGWSWLFPPHHWHLSAHAVEPTNALAFDARVLRDYAERNHDFGYELAMRTAQTILHRLQAIRLKLVDYFGLPAEEPEYDD